MPNNERQICCCGASSWTKVIGWFQIVINLLMVIVYPFSLATLLDFPENDLPNRGSAIGAVSLSLGLSVLGFIMGIILLIGANKRRVGFLKAFLIYGIAAILTSIVSLIISIVSIAGDNYALGPTVGSGVVGIGINGFCLAVVYIHIKEINAGVFTK